AAFVLHPRPAANLEFVPTQANSSPATSGLGSIGVFRPQNLTSALPKVAPPRASVNLLWANLNAPRTPHVNRLFTATGKKSRRGRRTGTRLNPSLTCPGSTRVDPDSQRLHLGCGCEHEIWPSVARQRHSLRSPRNRGGCGSPGRAASERMAQHRHPATSG